MHGFCSSAGPGISQECGLKRKLVGIHTMSLAFPSWGGALEDVLKGSVGLLLKKNHPQISLDSAGALGYLWITLTTQITLCTNSLSTFCAKPDTAVQGVMIMKEQVCAWGSTDTMLPPSSRSLLFFLLTCWFLAKSSALLTTKRFLDSAAMAYKLLLTCMQHLLVTFSQFELLSCLVT